MPSPLSRLTVSCLAVLSIPFSFANTVELDSQVVTARGYDSDSFTTPQAITVVKPDATDHGVVGELFRGQAGLALQNDGAWGKNPVIRGLSKESIVIMVDGFRVNSAQPQGAIASFASLGLLERAEVVKGPSSVVHGSGAMGGVVNMLTPEAQFSEQFKLGGRFGTSYSTVDKATSGAGLVTLSDTNTALLVGIAANNVHDYKSPDGRIKRTGYNSDSYLLKFKQRLAEDVVFRVNLQRHNDEDVWFPGSARTGGKPGGAGLPPPLGTVTIHSPNQHRELLSVGLDLPVLNGSLSTDVYRQEMYREIRAYAERLQRDYMYNQVRFVTHGLRSQWNGAITDSHWLSVGVDTWKMEGKPKRYISNNAPFFNKFVRNDPFKGGEIKSIGMFVQDEFSIGSSLVTLGARYDRVSGDAKQKGESQTTGLSRSDNNLSWNIGVVQPLTETLNLYGNLGQAYRAPDMRERFEGSARGDGYFHFGNPQLKPERSLTAELGLKGRNGEQSFQVATFYTQIDDFIAGRVTNQVHPQNRLPMKRTENLDKVIIYGVEGDFNYPVADFMFDAGFTWLRGKNKQDNEPLYQMPAPEMRLGIGQPTDIGLSWHAGLRLVAKQDRIAKRFSNGSENKTAGFVTADAQLGYGFGQVAGLSALRIDARLSNITDKTYHEHLTEGLSGYEIKAPGRSLTLAISGSF